MLSRFSNEVLAYGSSAVLPQNLSDAWLNVLQKRCDDFLDTNFAVDQCIENLNMGDPILIACVHEVLKHNRPTDETLTADILAENVTIYALSVTMETIRRETKMDMVPPDLDDLLSIDRIVRFGRLNPEFGRFLERACILPENATTAETGWFQRLKKKILSRMAAN